MQKNQVTCDKIHIMCAIAGYTPAVWARLAGIAEEKRANAGINAGKYDVSKCVGRLLFMVMMMLM